MCCIFKDRQGRQQDAEKVNFVKYMTEPCLEKTCFCVQTRLVTNRTVQSQKNVKWLEILDKRMRFVPFMLAKSTEELLYVNTIISHNAAKN